MMKKTGEMVGILGNCSLKRTFRFVAIAVFFLGSINIALKLYQNPYDDLPSFYWATHFAFEQSISPYQSEHFRELEPSFHQKIYPFLYPPPSLIIFSPMLLVDYDISKISISIINLFLWWLMAWTIYRFCLFHACSSDRLLLSTVVPLAMLVFVPTVDTLRTGQVNLLVLMCVFPLLFSPRHPLQCIVCGALLSIAIILKVYLLLIIPILFVFQQWRVLIGTLMGLSVFLLLSLLLLPNHLWLDWIELGRNSASYGSRVHNMITIPWNQSLNGFFIRQFIEEKSSAAFLQWTGYIYLSAGVVLCSMFYILMRYLRHFRRGFSSAIAIAMLVTTLIAPLTWLHHFVFVLPAIICCFGLLLRQSFINQKIIGYILVVTVVTLSFPPIVSSLFGGHVDCCSAEAIVLKKNLQQSVSLVAALTLYLIFCGLIHGASKDSSSNSQN